MNTRRPRYHRHRFPPEIISHAVWLYHRYCMSFRDVEDLLAERGIIVSYETVRQWCGKFGPDYARQLKRRQGRLGDTWFLDEVFVTINGQRQYLWRAVDQDGDLIDILVQPRRDGRAGSGRPGSLLTPAPHRSGRAGSAASGSSTDGFATRRRVPAGPGSQAMATAIPKAYLASSAIRCRDVETGPNLGVLAVFPSTGATCRCPLPSTGSRGLNSPASAVL